MILKLKVRKHCVKLVESMPMALDGAHWWALVNMAVKNSAESLSRYQLLKKDSVLMC
jgi:hypothetical protein